MLSGNHKSFLRFCAVGAVNTLIDFGVFAALFYGAGLHLVLANSLGFAAALVNSYVLNRFWTFDDGRLAKGERQFMAFAILAVMGVGISNIVITMLAPALGVPGAKLVAVMVTLAWNYTTSRYWVFRR